MHTLSEESVVEITQQNRINRALLDILPTLPIPPTMLVAGAVFQTYWNHRSGRPAQWGIKDYDIAYFDPDLSWEAEDQVIKQVQLACSHLGINVEIRNQARVHLWYEQKFGGVYPPLGNITQGIDRYLIRSTCLGIETSTRRLYSTYGLADLESDRLSINPLNPRLDLFMQKAASYQTRWPWLRLVE